MHTDRTITTDDDLVCFTQTQSSERNAGLRYLSLYLHPRSQIFSRRKQLTDILVLVLQKNHCVRRNRREA